jgi:predicted RNA-binding protein YlqC (UPF0109 family)
MNKLSREKGKESDLRFFVEKVVKFIVDKPDDVSVSESEEEGTTVFRLRVGQGDLGKVIGKNGQNANALRKLVGAIGAKYGQRVQLKILE